MKRREKKSFPRTSNDLAKMYKDGKLSFDNAVQRNLTWDNDQKSLLIHSMLIDYPIPAMYCNCIFEDPKQKVYDFLDGKQRTLGAIIPYLNDEYTLTNVPIINMDEQSDDDDEADPEKLIDVNGKKYSELPEELRDVIKNYSLTVYYYENLSQEEAEELIRRLNNGKTFTSIELVRIKAKSLDTIKEIGKHQIFDTALSEKAINKYTNEDIVIKSWAILNQETPNFETKNIKPMIEQAEITDEQGEQIITAYDKILEVYTALTNTNDKQDSKIAKRLLTRTHLISIIPLITKQIENETWDTYQFTQWVRFFFSGKKSATIDETYNEATKSGSGKTENIRRRLETIEESFKHFVLKVA
jgi:hypothetical protein